MERVCSFAFVVVVFLLSVASGTPEWRVLFRNLAEGAKTDGMGSPPPPLNPDGKVSNMSSIAPGESDVSEKLGVPSDPPQPQPSSNSLSRAPVPGSSSVVTPPPSLINSSVPTPEASTSGNSSVVARGPPPIAVRGHLDPPPPTSGDQLNPPSPLGSSPTKPQVPEIPAPIPGDSGQQNGSKSAEEGDHGETGLVPPAGKGNPSVKDQTTEKCSTSEVPCGSSLAACFLQSQEDPEELYLLVINKGGNSLVVNVAVAPSKETTTRNIAGNNHEKIKIRGDSTEDLKAILSTGDTKCIIPLRPSQVSFDAISPLISLYASRITPVYGAYAVFLTAIIAGATWACCKFVRRGRRTDSGVPYQQLEMGVQPPSSAVADLNTNAHTDTATGWDEGWDDDWDDEEAPRRPSDKEDGKNVETNGVSSKSSHKDGWNWDD